MQIETKELISLITNCLIIGYTNSAKSKGDALIDVLHRRLSSKYQDWLKLIIE